MPHTKRARNILVFTPEFEGPLKLYALGYIRKHKWRCDPIFDEYDLMQEAFLIFYKLSNYYPRVIEPAAFMALFKMSLANWFNDRAAYMQRKNTQHVYLDTDVSELVRQMGEPTNNGYMQALLEQAPHELKLALTLLTEHPDQLEAPKKRPGKRENLNMRLRRILGLSEGFNLRSALMELLFK